VNIVVLWVVAPFNILAVYQRFGAENGGDMFLLHDGKVKVRVSRYTPLRRMGGEEVYLLLILNLGTRWG
jgi:hypothetical protein